MGVKELQVELDELTTEGTLFDIQGDGSVRCIACAHRCLLRPGRRGICGVRYNQQGVLRVPWGYTAGMAVDPIEKKPFTHFMPGSRVLTFGMLGCNFHCDFCQNWHTSQVLRDPAIEKHRSIVERVSAETVVKTAAHYNAPIIASSYNEPIITAEWSKEIFQQAKIRGMSTAMVSNGYATSDVLDYLRPVMDGYKIDLKSLRESNYRSMGGVLAHVLDSIAYAWQIGLWVEVVTLVIPDYNNSPEELWDIARTIRSVSADIPWHVTGFHPDYKMYASRSTQPRELQLAADIGQEAGLHYVYAGNLPGKVGNLENTYCPNCQALLIERKGYTLAGYHITRKGTCPRCKTEIPGVWAYPTAPEFET